MSRSINTKRSNWGKSTVAHTARSCRAWLVLLMSSLGQAKWTSSLAAGS
jgi:hypothetical protein